MGTSKDSQATRAKLLAAAGRLFAEKGYKGVTVREIVKEADTHLSALNYHFRTKEHLYREVLAEACNVVSLSGADREALLELDPRQALFELVKGSLKHYEKHRGNNWQSAMLTRECMQPSLDFQAVVDGYLSPDSEFSARVISAVVSIPHDSYPVKFAVLTMIGLVDTFGMYTHMTEAVAPGLNEYGCQGDWYAMRIVDLVITAAQLAGQG